MRDERRIRARAVASDRRVAASRVGTADWVLANEAGWGFPHGGVVFLAGIVVGARGLALLIARIAAAVERALRQRRGST
ncbi:MAG TPA: hypothetical protein VGK16_03155 [Candidatus Limnocylindrales bacterium]|jgi:hypothetical protein